MTNDILSTLQNPEGLSDEALALAAADLLPLDEVAPTLGQRVLRWVIDGGPKDGLLGEVASHRDAAASSLKIMNSGNMTRGRRQFMKEAGFSPLPLKRLGELMVHASPAHWHASPPYGLPGWLHALQAQHSGVRGSVLADLLEAAGLDGSITIRPSGPADDDVRLLARYPEAVRETLRGADTYWFQNWLRHLSNDDADLSPFAEVLVERAITGSVQRRAAAATLLPKLGAAGRRALEAHASGSDAVRRGRAARTLAEHFGSEVRPFLEQRLEAERSRKNRELLEGLLASLAPVDPEVPDPEPLEPLPDRIPLPDGYRDEARRRIEEAIERRNENERKWAPRGAPPRVGRLREEALDQAMDAFETGAEQTLARIAAPQEHFVTGLTLAEALLDPSLSLEHVYRVLRAVVSDAGRRIFEHTAGWALPQLAEALVERDADLHAWAQVCERHGDPSLPWLEALISWPPYAGPLPMEPERIVPAFVGRVDLLLSAMAGRPLSPEAAGRYFRPATMQGHAYRIAAAFPELPPRVRELAFEHALGSGKVERALAQQLLATDGEVIARATEALGYGQKDVRAASADWLGRLGDASAVAALQKAVRKEKIDVPKAAMFRALERLGVDLESYLDRETLRKTAKKKLAKGVPAKVAWFPFAGLPELRWRDGEPVGRETLTWLLVGAHKLKSPEPSPLLRLYASYWDGAEELGDYVFEAWLEHDTRLPRREEVEAEVRSQVERLSWSGLPTDELFEQRLAERMEQPVGSAQADRGLLAVAAALCGPSLATRVQAYLKRWYGWRAPQCKTLLQMLAHRDDMDSVQTILATATRFRTKGIRSEAEKLVGVVAERLGWTPAELADRTIPTGGFELSDGRAVLELDMGPRTLTAILHEQLGVVIEGEGGRTSKSFPKPRKDDDPALAAASKKRFAQAKKAVNATVRAQRDRFYEAMCTERTWSTDDWRRHLLEHPVVGPLCERLIWVGVNAEGETTPSFRPLPDHALTDVDDETIGLDAPFVRLAHGSTLGPAVVERWREHFLDYEVLPLFDQLSAETVPLAEDVRKKTELNVVEGHIVDTFELRNRLQARGYDRKAAEDGGWFYGYERSYPTLGLRAEIGTSGSPLPEESRLVALAHVAFFRTADGGMGGRSMPLRDVPPILLAETVAHAREAAAMGTGFDPDWASKV